jgi:hypothetical protein
VCVVVDLAIGNGNLPPVREVDGRPTALGVNFRFCRVSVVILVARVRAERVIGGNLDAH